ncbi:MAG: ribosome maturation factor RimP [Gammaproteobacteria bacterium]|nr:ribosome maturation factor RimP [Gammaproteobacteria bacterium]
MGFFLAPKDGRGTGWATGPFFVWRENERVQQGAQETLDAEQPGSPTSLDASIERVVQLMDCELWGVEYVRAGRGARLVVYIEKSTGVDVDDCARVSRQLSYMLDVEDPVDGNYTLEVSSPGMDRKLFRLAQYETCAGVQVSITLTHPFEGRRRFKGLLCGVEGEDVVLRNGDEEWLLPFTEIERAQVVPSF